MSNGAQATRGAREPSPQLDVLDRVLSLLIEAGDLEQAAPAALPELARGLGFDAAVLWINDAQSARLRPIAAVGVNGAAPSDADREWFPSDVWSEQVTWITNLAAAGDAPGAVRARAASRSGFCSGVWVPIVSTKSVVGVIELFAVAQREAEALASAMLRTLGHVAGRLGERAALEQELWDAEARSRRSLRSAVAERTTELAVSRAHSAERMFLAEASGVLLSSLDESRMLATIVELAVPRMVALATIDLLPEGATGGRGPLRRAALAPTVEGRAGRVPPAPHAGSLAARVVHAGRAETVRRPSAEDLGTSDLPAGGALLAIAVPLIARGQTLGALTLAYPERPSDDSDLAFVQDLGARVASAVDNLRMVRRLQEALGARDAFLSIAAHELRTPITTLRLQLDMLREQAQRAGNTRVEPCLDRTLRQTDRLERLIERLLDVSRIMSQPLEIERRPTDLSELVGEVAEQLREQASRAGCKLVLRIHPAVGSWDRDRLEQVVTNLLLNALQYGAGRPVEVSVSATSQRARLSITDHGIGIAQQDVGRIFERFERAVSSHHYSGLGLGLFVANQVVQAHGGEIIVDSAPGTGSTFTVILPLAPQPVTQPPEHQAEASAGQGSLILVVEDDMDASQVVCDVLGDHGFMVRIATDGREAFEALQHGLRPALVLLDMMLPRMDGWQLMAAIKRDPELARLPVVLFSAHADVARAAEELGAAGYIEKPLGVDALLSAIVRHAHADADAKERQFS
jgi:signal transduction histidine kinase/ActR/RegA family two-component response regulator